MYLMKFFEEKVYYKKINVYPTVTYPFDHLKKNLFIRKFSWHLDGYISTGNKLLREVLDRLLFLEPHYLMQSSQ